MGRANCRLAEAIEGGADCVGEMDRAPILSSASRSSRLRSSRNFTVIGDLDDGAPGFTPGPLGLLADSGRLRELTEWLMARRQRLSAGHSCHLRRAFWMLASLAYVEATVSVWVVPGNTPGTPMLLLLMAIREATSARMEAASKRLMRILLMRST